MIPQSRDTDTGMLGAGPMWRSPNDGCLEKNVCDVVVEADVRVTHGFAHHARECRLAALAGLLGKARERAMDPVGADQWGGDGAAAAETSSASSMARASEASASGPPQCR